MTDYHPAPFNEFSTELRDPWPVVERLRMALREAERYCLGAENITGLASLGAGNPGHRVVSRYR
jgi:hypothetical protein